MITRGWSLSESVDRTHAAVPEGRTRLHLRVSQSLYYGVKAAAQRTGLRYWELLEQAFSWYRNQKRGRSLAFAGGNTAIKILKGMIAEYDLVPEALEKGAFQQNMETVIDNRDRGKCQLLIDVSSDLMAEMETIAKRQGTTTSQVARTSLRVYLGYLKEYYPQE